MKRALLLACDNYVDSGLKLDAAAIDVAQLGATLLRLGYRSEDISERRSSSVEPLTTSVLRRQIFRLFSEAQPGDELLLYISAHGIDLDGHRLIVPVDFFRDMPRPASELLGDEEIYVLARASQAASVVVLIDACREPLELAFAPVGKGPGTPEPKKESVADAPTIAIVYSSEPGELSWARSGPKGMSYFTEALCDILIANEDASQLGEIIDLTRDRLGEILPRGNRQVPYFDERHQIVGRAGAPKDIIVKESEAARLRQQISASGWCAMLKQTSSWQAMEDSPGLAAQLEVLAARAEELSGRARTALPGGRWQDDGWIERFFEALYLLAPAGSLDPAEAALCLSVPFVYEATLAALASELLKQGDLLAETEGAGKSLPRRAWRGAIEREEDWARRRAHLQRTGETESAADLLEWQLWMFAHQAGELWAYSDPQGPRQGWLNEDFRAFFALAPFKEIAEDEYVAEVFTAQRLLRLARLSFAEPEDIEGEASRPHSNLQRELWIGSGQELWKIDELLLAHLAALAGTMAFDARRLPSILADHLGLDGFVLPRLQEELSRARWQQGPKNRTLALTTCLPQLHAALGEVVRNLERHRSRIAARLDVRVEIEPALQLPFDDARLLPTKDSAGKPLFDPHHLRFTLDQRRVVALLMGKQLYGDPELALRELYQNALDACRYRRAREAYVAIERGAADTYQPAIKLRAGSERGRPVIICEDNGIGMEERHLRDLFARAGRRFTDSHEYHVDLAKWQEAGISFWPNSRFGIGVLSYFMLAEEIEIETRRVEPDGNLADEGLVVQITGSGSLFRVTSDRSVRRDGGTRITLYPKDTELDPDKLLDSVFEWLLIPGVDVAIVRCGANAKEELLEAGKPTPVCHAQAGGELLAVEAGADSHGAPRIYWRTKSANTPSVDLVLVDGIKSQSASAPPNLVVNLAEEWSGGLSVDRKVASLPDEFAEWVASSLLADKGDALLSVELKSEKLAALVHGHFWAILELDRLLRSKDLDSLDRTIDYPPGSAPISCGLGVGLWDGQIRDLLGPQHERPEVELDRLLALRLVEFHEAGLPLPQSLRILAEFQIANKTTTKLGVGAQLALPPRGYDNAVPVTTICARDLLLESISFGYDIKRICDILPQISELYTLAPDVARMENAGIYSDITFRLLTKDFDGLPPFVNRVSANNIIQAAIRTRLSPHTIAEAARTLEALDLVEANLDDFDTLTEPLDSILRGWSRGNELEWFIDEDIDPAEAATILAPLEMVGLLPTSAVQLGELARISGPGRLLSTYLRFRAGQPVLTLASLLSFAAATGRSMAASFEIAESLREIVEINIDPELLADADLLLPGLNALMADENIQRRVDDSWSRDQDPRSRDQIGFNEVVGALIQGTVPQKQLMAAARWLAGQGLLDFPERVLDSLSVSTLVLRGLRKLADTHDISRLIVSSARLHRLALHLSLDASSIEELLKVVLELGEVQGDFESREYHRMTATLFAMQIQQDVPITAATAAIAAHCADLDIDQLAPAVDDLEICGLDVTEARALIRFAEENGTGSRG